MNWEEILKAIGRIYLCIFTMFVFYVVSRDFSFRSLTTKGNTKLWNTFRVIGCIVYPWLGAYCIDMILDGVKIPTNYERVTKIFFLLAPPSLFGLIESIRKYNRIKD